VIKSIEGIFIEVAGQENSIEIGAINAIGSGHIGNERSHVNGGMSYTTEGYYSCCRELSQWAMNEMREERGGNESYDPPVISSKE
jgi:hypothetical protein